MTVWQELAANRPQRRSWQLTRSAARSTQWLALCFAVVGGVVRLYALPDPRPFYYSFYGL
ncbi:MAG: hypothetical protein R2867_39040 [Caldilineaceae bacterium]